MTCKLDIEFKRAFKRVSETKRNLPPDVLLRLYAYYKQVIKGDDSFFEQKIDNNIRDAFKFNARMQLKGMSEEEAKQEYVNLANEVLK